MFLDILTFLGLYYRVASLITLYFVVPGINIPKIRSIGLDHITISCKIFKMNVRKFGNDYRVATLSNSYLTTKGIIMQNFKSIGQF